MLLRYEDMIANTTRELARIAGFLNVRASQDRVREIVELSSADRMRALEQSQSQQWVATKDRRKDIPFVRVAQSGGWKSLLPPVCVATIESAWGDLMETVGYKLSAVESAGNLRSSAVCKR
jgi:hypothetical protein